MKIIFLSSIFTIIAFSIVMALININLGFLIMGIFIFGGNLGIPIILIISLGHIIIKKSLKTDKLTNYYIVFTVIIITFITLMILFDHSTLITTKL